MGIPFINNTPLCPNNPTYTSTYTRRPTLSLPRSLSLLLPKTKRTTTTTTTLLFTLTVRASSESDPPITHPSVPISSTSPQSSLSFQHQTESSLPPSNFPPKLQDNLAIAIDNGNVGGPNNLGGSDHGNGGGGDAGNGKGNGDDDGKAEDGDDEFGPLLSFQEVMQETEARGITLPADMLEAAQNGGIQKLLLLRYFEMQASAWPLGEAIQFIPLLRNRMLADPSFLFKIGTEIIIDSCCATVAEVQKRGKDFWSEFELYAADLLVGVVVNVALVGMLAPYARFGRASASQQPGLLAHLQHAYDALPSSVFEAERPGYRFTVQQRTGTYFYKGVLYGAVGFACGLVGQGIANLIMTAKRSVKKSDEDVPVPPLFKSAALWGAFLAVSSNTRYQIINGLERLVEASPVARQVPPVAMAFTVGIRFANNIYGGMQFVDWARMTGCQ